MEFKGDEFLKKVEQANAKRDNQDLFEQNDVYPNEDNGYPNKQNASSYNNEPNSELEDILLSSSSSSDDKKKYIILGASLVILFLITLILIKVFSGSSDSDTLTQSKPEQISQDKALESQSIEQEYQRIINERLKKLQEQKEAQQVDIPSEQPVTEPTQIVETTEEVAVQKDSTPTVQKDVVQNTPTQATTPKQPTQTIKQEPKQTTTKPATATTNSLQGFYVQVGAFSREPNKQFLTQIQTSGYQYKIYQDMVNGINYNKVLVGPYNSKAEASANIENIKKALGLNSAFILGF